MSARLHCASPVRSTDRAGERWRLSSAAGSVALVVGGPVGLVVGLVVGVAAFRVIAGAEPAARRRQRRAIDRDLPVALDLLAACLLAQAARSAAAVRAVATGVAGAVGAEFAGVLAALDLGVAPAEAWLALPEGPLRSVGRAFARAATSGAPLAETATALADERRAAVQAEAQAAARRAGVAAVAPLGLCFLPAFVCTAVVPVVAGLATRVLA